jgi:two-component system LytT family response regulator
MIRALLIDDEQYIREGIKDKITQFFNNEIEVVAEANSVFTAVKAINVTKPDLVFLDIEIEEGTGFDVLQQCTYKSFEVIFVTGFDDQAIKAIKVGALDYLLKPVDDDEFKAAVLKTLQTTTQENNVEKQAEAAYEYWNDSPKKKIILKTLDYIHSVYEEDIIYCKSEGNYTTFYIKNADKIVVSKPLKKIEESLSKNDFIRCHQSYIVNKNYVLKYSHQGFLIINPDIKIPVSSSRKDGVLKAVF